MDIHCKLAWLIRVDRFRLKILTFTAFPKQRKPLGRHKPYSPLDFSCCCGEFLILHSSQQVSATPAYPHHPFCLALWCLCTPSHLVTPLPSAGITDALAKLDFGLSFTAFFLAMEALPCHAVCRHMTSHSIVAGCPLRLQCVVLVSMMSHVSNDRSIIHLLSFSPTKHHTAYLRLGTVLLPDT